MIYKIKDFRRNDIPMEFFDEEWIPCRPLNYKYRSFAEKVKDAWSVFSGKADAFIWKD